MTRLRDKVPLLVVGLFIASFFLPAYVAFSGITTVEPPDTEPLPVDFGVVNWGWECAWEVLSFTWVKGITFSGLLFAAFLNLANFGMLFGWWSWRINRIRLATLSFTVASISAAYWSIPSLVMWDLGSLSPLKVGYWVWLTSIVFSARLAFHRLRAASKRSST